MKAWGFAAPSPPELAAACLLAAALAQEAMQHGSVPFRPFTDLLQPALARIWLDTCMLTAPAFETVLADLDEALTAGQAVKTQCTLTASLADPGRDRLLVCRHEPRLPHRPDNPCSPAER
jgi:hypothetical protein